MANGVLAPAAGHSPAPASDGGCPEPWTALLQAFPKAPEPPPTSHQHHTHFTSCPNLEMPSELLILGTSIKLMLSTLWLIFLHTLPPARLSDPFVRLPHSAFPILKGSVLSSPSRCACTGCQLTEQGTWLPACFLAQYQETGETQRLHLSA